MRVKKWLTAMLAVVMATSVSVFVGCNPNQGGGASTLEILLTDAGYGTDWCYTLADKFAEQAWVKEKYPELEVKIMTSDDQTLVQSKLSSDPNANYYDLLFYA